MIPDSFLPAALIAGIYLTVLPWCRSSNSLVRASILFVGFVLGVRLLYWELGTAIPRFDLSGAVIAVYLLVGFQIWRQWEARKHVKMVLRIGDRSPEADQHQDWYTALAQEPLIYILIPTYNEAWDILETVIVAAKAQDYPRYKIWILDDGRREWLREATERAGVSYVSRGTNRDFKAGNLNDGLVQILASNPKPDFISVLDADFVALPRFLRRTLALMHDPRVAIVQTPQHYYNSDPLQYALRAGRRVPDSMRRFFSYYLACNDARGKATCVGTSYLLRFECIGLIGGWPTEAICEDTLLSLKLRRLGWRTVFLNEALSFGLSPEGLLDMFAQQGRWQISDAQIAQGAWGPRSRHGGIYGWYAYNVELYELALLAAWRWIRLCLPMLFGFFGFHVWRMSAEEFARYVLPLSIYSFGTVWMSGGIVAPVLDEANALLLSSTRWRATFRAIWDRSNLRFNVTPKGINRDGDVIHWRLLSALLAATVLTVVAAVAKGSSAEDPLFALLFILWSGRSIQIMTVAMLACLERSKHRKYERFPTRESAELTFGGTTRPVTVCDLSVSGACIRTDEDLPVPSKVCIALRDLPSIEAEVIRRTRAGAIGLRFSTSESTRQALIRKVFCSGEYVVAPSSYAYFAMTYAVWRGIVLGLAHATRVLWRSLSGALGERAWRGRSRAAP